VKRSPEAEAAPLVLTGEGFMWVWATVLFGGLGWYKSISLVLLLAYLMFALLLVNGVLARRNARRLSAAREPLPPLFAGEDAAVRLTATNTGTRPATATVEDRAGENAPAWLVFRLAAGESTSGVARRTFPRRGRFSAPIRVTSAYPFGLLQYERPVPGGPELVVLPAVGVADPDGLRQWLLRQAGGEGRARKVLRRVTTDQADVRGLRAYRAGDSIRSVHWRSSARRRELMVREYDAAPAPDLVLVVEPWLPAEPTDLQLDRLEAALSLAATIVHTWGRVYGTKVTVAVAGDPGSVRTGTPSDVGVREALEPLAEVAGGTSFEPLGPQTFGRPLAQAARLVVSSRHASPYADALTRGSGRPFASVSPLDRLPWYQPPKRAEA
jgi:uncharacterized protein (DUF58 family)